MDTSVDAGRQRFLGRVARRFLLRFHLAFVLTGALSGGVLASRVLSAAGVEAMAVRYGVAVGVAYTAFLVLVILPEGAFEAAVTTGLVKAERRGEFGGWAGDVVRSTAFPFVLVLGTAVLLGWSLQFLCPTALRLLDVLASCS